MLRCFVACGVQPFPSLSTFASAMCVGSAHVIPRQPFWGPGQGSRSILALPERPWPLPLSPCGALPWPCPWPSAWPSPPPPPWPPPPRGGSPWGWRGPRSGGGRAWPPGRGRRTPGLARGPRGCGGAGRGVRCGLGWPRRDAAPGPPLEGAGTARGVTQTRTVDAALQSGCMRWVLFWHRERLNPFARNAGPMKPQLLKHAQPLSSLMGS